MRAGVLFALFAVSCAAGPRGAGSVSIAPKEKLAWTDAIAEATRRDEPYDWAVRQADVRATLITPRVRKAFIDARADFHGKFIDETARELVELGEPDPGVDVESRPRPESEEQVIFFVAMYVTDQKNRDISAGYTIWETLLQRGDAIAAPIKIDVVRSSPAVSGVFPYADRFDDLYFVRFPLTDAEGRPFLSPGPEPLRLLIKSALAEATLEWTLEQ